MANENLFWYQHNNWATGVADNGAWQGPNKVGDSVWQTYKNVFTSSNGIIYGIDAAGDLYWYQHDGWQSGTADWKGPNKVGNGGWQAYKSVFASSEGIIYAIDDVGDLYWYQHDGWQSGTADWKGPNKVGNGGWQAYKSVFASSEGIIYAIDDVGDLYWYQHDGWQSGTADWKGPNKVGNGGWQAYKSVFASSAGIIYAIDDVRDLYWYQHDGWQSGTADWKGRNKVGNGGWQAYRLVLASHSGIIYGVGVGINSTPITNTTSLADISGSWNIIGNQSAGVLKIAQLASPSACKPIEGTIYEDSKVVGYYCTSTGRLAFTRQINDQPAAAQMWVGNVSDVSEPNRMGGTFHAVNTGVGSGALGEYGFQGTK